MKALDLKDIFHQKLDAIYGKNEVESIFFLSLKHYLNIPRFQLALDPKFTLTQDETNLFFKTRLKQNTSFPTSYTRPLFYGLQKS